MSGFKAKGIRKVFGSPHQIEVLSDLDLDIEKGELISIVGASGTGKTTLMHILGTLDRPNAGSFIHNGEDIFLKNDLELCHFRNKTIGFVFQFHHLLPEFSAYENILMPGLISGVNQKELQKNAMELLEKVGLTERKNHKVGELSGGEQQRVALARALILKPALLLADEPTGNLDPKTGRKVFDLILEMNREFSLSTIMVTHNLELARKTDRCLTLVDGKLHELNRTEYL